MAVALAFTLADVPLSPQSARAAAAAATACPADRSDRTSAVIAARLCGGRVEALSERTETTQVWAEANGSLTAEVAAGPVRFRQPDGSWVPVDLTLHRAPDGAIVPQAHPRGLRLSGPQAAGDHDLAVLGTGADQVALGWRGALPAPVLDGVKATYPQVRPGVDLVVEATRTGVEQFLVVKDRAALAQLTSVRLPWRTPSAAVASGDGLRLRGVAGTDIGEVPPAQMWDASVDPDSGEHRRRGSVAIATAAQGLGTDLVLTPDAAFLARPDLTFPVTIDPTVSIGSNFDTWVQSDFSSDQSTSTELKVGYNGSATARSFLTFDTSSFIGASISTATLYLWEYHSWSCRAAGWDLWKTGAVGTGTRWTSQPAWLASNTTYRSPMCVRPGARR